MQRQELEHRLAQLRAACERLGATGFENAAGESPLSFELAPPAGANEIEHVERQLHQRLPTTLREFFLRCSKRMAIGWFLPENAEPPAPFEAIFCGMLIVDLDELVSLQARYESWCEVFPNDNDYDRTWRNKFAIARIANGDLIAIEVNEPQAQRVVFLSHDGSSRNGFVLGENFDDYLDRFSRLGFVGPEDWQWEAFADENDRIDPHGAIAQQWRQWLGLQFRGNG